MSDLRKFRPRSRFRYVFLPLLALSILVAAQDKDKDRDEKEDKNEKKKTASSAHMVKVEGDLRCDKPETEHSIEVPDRPEHVLTLTRRKCNWTEPMTVLGAKTKDGVAVDFIEQMEGGLHVHGFETDTLDNGEKITWQSMGQVLGIKGPATSKGRWSLMRGTGKFKGVKGGGTYEGKLDADDVLTLEFEGVYDPSELVGAKK
jgi:hypothetical protein